MSDRNSLPEPPRLLPCFLPASDDGLACDAVMLCEMIGDEIQSVSLRVAAESLARFRGGPPFGSVQPRHRQE